MPRINLYSDVIIRTEELVGGGGVNIHVHGSGGQLYGRIICNFSVCINIVH